MSTLMLTQASMLSTILEPVCRPGKLVIAGSIRRRKPDPGDIEIVAYPLINSTTKHDLFGNVVDTTNYNAFDEMCEKLLEEGILTKRPNKHGRFTWGQGVKYALYGETKVDLFSCIPPSSWGATLAIRTGPGDFNKLLVTAAKWDGACPRNRKVAGGRAWNLDSALNLEASYDFARMSSTQFLKVAGGYIDTVPTETEEEFFAALGIPCWDPWDRTVERLTEFLRQKRRE